MRNGLGVGFLLLGSFFAPQSRASTTIATFTITGNGISASGTMTLVTTATPGVDEIIGITGSFSTTNAGGFSGAISGLSPGSYDSSDPTPGALSFWDNLFYPAGSAPGLFGYPPGGTLDDDGLDFIVDGIYTVNVFSRGNGSLLSDGIITYVDKDAPVSFVVNGLPPTLLGVVSAASYATDGFSPGSIVTIFGGLLGPPTALAFSIDRNGNIVDTLGGTTVTVVGIPAIPLFVSNDQINLILPFTLGTSGNAAVQVQYNGLASDPWNIPLAPADVQVFAANSSGSGPGSISNQDYSVNTATNPAPPGSLVSIYGTGAGALTPAVSAGAVAGNALSWVALPYSATVNGENATVTYAGSAPGLVYGVDQFNLQLPNDVPSGAQKIVLKVGNSVSQPDVTVFVR
jgi:uncharacterized protein (TIGR03437 family)